MERVEEKEEQKKGSFLERKERVTEEDKSNELTKNYIRLLNRLRKTTTLTSLLFLGYQKFGPAIGTGTRS